MTEQELQEIRERDEASRIVVGIPTDQCRDALDDRTELLAHIDATTAECEELKVFEKFESDFMHAHGIHYDETLLDGWIRVLNERDELRAERAALRDAVIEAIENAASLTVKNTVEWAKADVAAVFDAHPAPVAAVPVDNAAVAERIWPSPFMPVDETVDYRLRQPRIGSVHRFCLVLGGSVIKWNCTRNDEAWRTAIAWADNGAAEVYFARIAVAATAAGGNDGD